MDSPRRPLLVSRRHAELTYDAEADVWVLADLKSVNGVFVNGKKVTHGDLVTFDERGGRTPANATKKLKNCACVYHFHKSGYNTRPRGKADQRTTTAATTGEPAAGSASADTAPPVAKRPRKDPAAEAVKAAPTKANVPDSQEENDEEEEQGEEEEEEEQEEEKKEKEGKNKQKFKEEKEEEKEEEEEKEKEEEEEEETKETKGVDKKKKNGEEEEEEEKASGTATNGSSTPTKGTGCRCGKNKAAGLMIQCDSCTSWSHAGCVGLSKAKAAQLKSWQCETCRSKGVVPVPPANAEEDDPRQWTLAKGTIICCLPEPTSGDLFWIAEVVSNKRKGQRTVQVRWFENDPRKRKLHYVRGAEQRLEVATITCPDVSDLLSQVGPNLYKLQDDPRLYAIA